MEAPAKTVTAEDLAGDIESIEYGVSYKPRGTLTAKQEAIFEAGVCLVAFDWNYPRAANCRIRMKNGMFVVGDGPVRSAAEYDDEIDRVAAYNDAMAQIVKRENFFRSRNAGTC